MIVSVNKLFSLCSKEDILSLKKLFVLTLIVGLLEIAGIASIIPFLQLASDPAALEPNVFTNSVFSFFGVSGYQSKLVFIGWFVLLFFTLSNAISAVSGWIIQKLGWHLAHTISSRIADTYLHLPFEDFMQKEIAELIKSSVADVYNLVNNVLIAGCRFFTSVLISLIIIILLIIIEPVIAGVSFLLLTVTFLTIFLLRRNYISKLGKEQLEHNSRRFITFSDLLNGNRTIQSSNAQSYFYNRFVKPSLLFSEVQPKLFLNGSLPRYVIETIMFGVIILSIIFLANDNTKDFVALIPTITLFALAAYRLLPSINSAYVSATLVISHHHTINRLYDDFSARNNELSTSTKSIEFNQTINFQNVSYSYPTSNDRSLKNISFNIARGQNTAIVGTSGSGKTTVGGLIVGLLTPSDGSIAIDNTVRTREHFNSWIDNIGHVPQEVFLYNGSIEENICFGLERNEERLLFASNIAQAHGFITSTLPDKYLTMVGDSGIRLSGGQKQRIGIARAIYRQPKLLLLDEATSALDTKTEKLILDKMYTELSDTTLVIIAHRLSTVRNCDNLLLLDHGELVSEGTFDELLMNSELFKELCSYV